MGRPRRVRVSSRKRSAAPGAAASGAVAPVSAPESTVPTATAPVAPVEAHPAEPVAAPGAQLPGRSAGAGLAEELKTLVEGLLFLSESEAPFTVVQLPKEAILPDALRALTKLPADAPAEEWAVADLLTPFTAPDQPDAARYQALLAFLESKLTRATVYKLGEVKKPVFFVGRQPDKSWLGVQTEAVET